MGPFRVIYTPIYTNHVLTHAVPEPSLCVHFMLAHRGHTTFQANKLVTFKRAAHSLFASTPAMTVVPLLPPQPTNITLRQAPLSHVVNMDICLST